MSRRRILVLAVLAAFAACGEGAAPGTDGEKPSITIYSGRSQELVGPILGRFSEQTGIEVQVRYGDTAELAAAILEEGANTPADVFFGQDAGALGALAKEDRLAPLPDDLLARVPAEMRSPDGSWIGISGRARVLVYNTGRVEEGELPASVFDLTDDNWRDRLGWAPTNGSFQSFLTAMRLLAGEEKARSWLTEVRALGTLDYEKNSAIVEAVAAGEVDLGLVNHYYLLQLASENPAIGDNAANHFLAADDPGSLVNVAGVGILNETDAPDAAHELVEFLLSEEAQTYFATETFEYPLIAGVEPDPRLPSLEEINPPDIDLSDLDDLQGTLRLLAEVGVL